MGYFLAKQQRGSSVNLPAPKSAWAALRLTIYFAGQHRGVALANTSAALLYLIFSFAFPQVTQFLIDDVIGKDRSDLMLPTIGVLIGAYALKEVFQALRIRANALFEQSVALDMRRVIQSRLQRLSMSFFDFHVSGDLIARITDDVTVIEKVIVDGGESGLFSILSLLLVSCVLVDKNLELAVCTMLPLPFLVIGILWYSPRAHASYREQRQANATAVAILSENIQGIREVKAFGIGGEEGLRFTSQFEALADKAISLIKTWSIYNGFSNFLSSLGVVAVLWIGGLLVISKELTIGELVSFIFFLPLLYEPIIELNRLNQLFQAARAAGERISEILEAEEEICTGELELKSPVAGEVSFKNVGFSFMRGKMILDDINISVHHGQTVAIVGPTGCGKSTLVNLLLGFYQPSSGKIEIDGQDIRSVTKDSVRSAISLVSQSSVKNASHATMG